MGGCARAGDEGGEGVFGRGGGESVYEFKGFGRAVFERAGIGDDERVYGVGWGFEVG